ncbi:MAG TPA: sigma 54-interacting transcriptional regulator [Burkholderiaceae bacterium]|nr:sigma 54-interacting transcriptional regulator [Burkholderiaceae bacterium]
MDPLPDTSIGVLVRKGTKLVMALGMAAEPANQHALLAAWAEVGDRAMFEARMPAGPCVGVSVSDGETDIAIVRQAAAEGTLLDFVAAVPFAFDLLDQLLNDPYRAITVADHTGTMCYVSPVHEKFLGFSHGGAIGKAAEDAIPNSRLRAVIQTGKAEIGKPLKLSDDVTRVVSRRPILRNGEIVGAVGQVMFRDTEALSRMATEMTELRSQLEFYRKQLDGLREDRQGLAELIGESQAMQRLRREVATVAKLDVPVLILGESGTGKELVTRAIHNLGRPGQALVSLNLAALPASLIEAELFGHAAGAFTGSARQGRAGKFEMANDGTLFLDEVGDIPMDIQIKLLRVLEERVVERLGSHASQRTTFRLVAATHRDIDALIESGAFRHDLFYRISGVTLHVPPLRDRLEDIPALTNHFVKAFCQRNGLPIPQIDSGLSRYLADQPWPGNLRQLRHRIEEALVFSRPDVLALDAFTRNDSSHDGSRSESVPSATPLSAATRLKDHERAAALRAVEECGGNKKRAAERLGISRSYLYKLLA